MLVLKSIFIACLILLIRLIVLILVWQQCCFEALALSKAAFEPEVASGFVSRPIANANKYMVVTSNSIATKAAVEVLDLGGNAIDAMIAGQLVLNLVEPQSSGLGGGGFALYYDAKERKLYSFDARETAPAKATANLFLDPVTGKELKFCDAVRSSKSIGVPGLPKLLYLLHKQHGKHSWHQLSSYAQDLAQDGFIVPKRLSKQLNFGCMVFDKTSAATKSYFFPQDKSLEEGSKITNLEFSRVLHYFKQYGARPFYKGKIAQDMVLAASLEDGILTTADFETYEVKERLPLCFEFSEHKICSMGPPSSGAITLGQILGVLENFAIANEDITATKVWHLFLEASKLAFADRAKYIADPDFVVIPARGLLDKDYLHQRSKLISEFKIMEETHEPGIAPGTEHLISYGLNLDQNYDSTTHISIVDPIGNAISLTSSIEHAFGSQIMNDGFLLNNQLTDFSFLPKQGEKLVANRVEPGKRPRSSMSPTVVFDKHDKPVLILGSAGGAKIIPYVAKFLLAVLMFKQDIKQALELPNIVNLNESKSYLEKNASESLKYNLEQLGHKIVSQDLTSGTNVIQLNDDGVQGLADPRREGLALGF